MRSERGLNVPSRIIVSNRSQARLDEIRRIHGQIPTTARLDYVLARDPRDNDAVVASVKPGSLVINATGLGKDAPGSPLTNGVQFPERAIVWDLNYRGNLIFLDQARAQEKARHLQIEDGWTYFVHGWTQVIAEVFHIDIPTSGPDFDALARIAGEVGAVKRA
jgi:shikimate 5-dehydrogenase